jgi:hypothetical protein
VICYDLCCAAAHKFEGWFGSAADYELQRQRGLIACPVCDDIHIEKLLSAPNVGRKGNQAKPAGMLDTTPILQGTATGDTASIVSNAPVISPAMAEMIEKVADVQREMLKKSEWVGRDFAEAARAIHYGETPNRLIHGETSPAEAKILSEEGVGVAPLLFPFVPPEAKN